MKTEAIIYVSGENAWKFLKLTLPHNCQFFDHIVLVGSAEDEEEFSKLRQENITCIVTDTTSENIKTFDRGAAYNTAFTYLKHNDWVVTLDADVLIPLEFQNIKKSFNFNNEFCYGSRRLMLPRFHDFAKLFNEGIDINDYITPYGIGYGYFCMINWQSQVIKNKLINDEVVYPKGYEGVGESDWKFRNQWGETSYGEKEYLGNLAELPMTLIHLGDSTKPNPSENFWK